MDADITFRMETKNLPKDIEESDESWIVEYRRKGQDDVLGTARVKKKADSDRGIIEHIEVVEEYQRMGIATGLAERIREEWPRVQVSEGFTDKGKAFVNTLPPEIVWSRSS